MTLVDMYNEQALRNRIENRKAYETQIADKLKSIDTNDIDSRLEFRLYYTMQQYTITFKSGKLPARRREPKMPFTFVNDVELDRLASLNKKINEGVTLDSLRNDLAKSEKFITEKEKQLAQPQKDIMFFKDLHYKAVKHFEQGCRIPADMDLLKKSEITVQNYKRITELIANDENEIARIEQAISEERDKMKTTTETLTAFEEIFNMTYVQRLVEAEKNRRQVKKIGNGIKSADASTEENNRINVIVNKIEKDVEQKIAEPDKPIYIAPKRK
jgi:hypothetical protein